MLAGLWVKHPETDSQEDKDLVSMRTQARDHRDSAGEKPWVEAS